MTRIFRAFQIFVNSYWWSADGKITGISRAFQIEKDICMYLMAWAPKGRKGRFQGAQRVSSWKSRPGLLVKGIKKNPPDVSSSPDSRPLLYHTMHCSSRLCHCFLVANHLCLKISTFTKTKKSVLLIFFVCTPCPLSLSLVHVLHSFVCL